MDGDALKGRGLAARMLFALRRPRASFLAEARGADEARLLFYAFLGSGFFALGRIGAAQIRGGAELREAAMTGAVGALFFRPLALYAVAGVIFLIARGFGGAGDARDTRLALFWSGLVAAPFGALAAALGAAAGDVAPVAAEGAGSLLWAALLAPMLAAAHGFDDLRKLWLVVAALGGAIVAASLLA